ncbi:hypothetical protein CRI84_06250 [Liquorilactobacillus hordei]|nr:hypothetical protein [Liquorilactobacillus hordei]
MTTVQLILLLLVFSLTCAIIFFILLFKMTQLQKKMKRLTADFNQLTNKYKKDKLIDNKDINQLSLAIQYNPATFFPLILILNMIPVITLLVCYFLETPHYFLFILLFCFILAAFLLPLYYLYLKKHVEKFFLSYRFKSNKNTVNPSCSKLISEFDNTLSPVIIKKVFNTLQAYELINVTMICCTVLRIVLPVSI